MSYIKLEGMFPFPVCVPEILFAIFSYGYLTAFISLRGTNSDIANFSPFFYRSTTTPNVP